MQPMEDWTGKRWILSIASFCLAGLFVADTWVIVGPGHRGVRTTLGRVSEGVIGEGLCFKLPLVQRVSRISVKQYTMEGDAPCFSSDLQTIHVKFNCLYRVSADRVVTLFQKYQGDPYETLVEPRIQECMKQATALHRAEDLVREREKIKHVVLDQVKAVVGDFVEIADIVVNNIDLTPELEKSIEAKVVKEQYALAKVFEMQAAQKDADIVLIKARAEAQSVQIRGAAVAMNPQVVVLEAINRWDGKAPQTLMIDRGVVPVYPVPGVATFPAEK